LSPICRLCWLKFLIWVFFRRVMKGHCRQEMNSLAAVRASKAAIQRRKWRLSRPLLSPISLFSLSLSLLSIPPSFWLWRVFLGRVKNTHEYRGYETWNGGLIESSVSLWSPQLDRCFRGTQGCSNCGEAQKVSFEFLCLPMRAGMPFSHIMALLAA
jgi:hypothetical protein